MKTLRLVILAASCAFAFILKAQDTSSLSDFEIELQALEATTPTAATNAPELGTFYSAQNPNSAPLPANVNHSPVWSLGSGFYILSDANVDYAALSQSHSVSRMSLHAMDEMDEDDFVPALNLDRNSLYLQITNVADGMASLNLMNATDYVYEIYSKTDLTATNWDIESEVFPTDTVSMPFNVPQSNRTNLFLWSRDWTGVTSDGNMTPEWWFYKYFGTTELADTNLDSLGDTLLYDYQHLLDPNIISFSIETTNHYVNHRLATVQLNITGGEPGYYAIFASNNPGTNWQAFVSTNITVDLGATDGVFEVLVGLRGLSPDATPTWMVAQLILDTVAPTLLITNPMTGTVSAPLIQVQGLADENLSSVVFDVSNAAGIFTNQTGYIMDQFWDTNLLAFTTNYFQCYDVALTNGLNSVSVHAFDLAGNETTTNLNFTLDYSGDTNPPVLALVWPTNGTSIAGSNVTVQAQIDDATATVTATVNSNTVAGLVERDGTVWINNLPLDSGTNTVTLTAADAAGNMSETNLCVVQSSVNVTIDPISGDQLNQSSVTVTGSMDNPADTITVNGVSAEVNDDGTWEADNVPVNWTGMASLDVEVSDSDNNPVASQSVSQPQPAMADLMSYSYNAIALPTEDIRHWTYLAGGDWLLVGVFGGSSELPFQQISGNENNSYSYHVSDEDPPGNVVTRTRMMIAPSKPATGGIRLYDVQAQVLGENLSPLGNTYWPLAPESVTIGGAALKPIIHDDGSVWGETLVSAPAGVHADITPTAPGNTQFSVQAQEVTLHILDANNGTDLTAQTNTVIVGQQMNLFCQLSITNFPLANFQWTVQGTTFSNYVADSSTGILNTNFSLTQSNALFCWSDSGLKLMNISATVNGKTVTGQAWFNVVRPMAQIVTTSGTVGLDTITFPGAPVLHYGDPGVGFVPGMLFSNTVTMPSGNYNSGNTNYSIQWVQMGISFDGQVETNDGSGAWYEAQAANMLDTSYPYGFDTYLPYPCTEDSPHSQGLSPYIAASFSETFEMWLMFKPVGGQWVPLQGVAWSWSGSGSLDGPAWQLTDSANTVNPVGVNTTTFPTWTDNLTNHINNFQKE
ncbi:MAG TPA: hypothetical protein VIK59_08995 [Verrucomicrobiae bacterium]